MTYNGKFYQVDGLEWTENLGEMTWDDGIEKSKTFGLRLPTIEELRALWDSGEEWARDDNNYWSSSMYDNTNKMAKFFKFKYGDTDAYLFSDDKNVRLVKGQLIERKGYRAKFYNGVGLEWTINLGLLNWRDATKKANEIGMRLPTIEELKKLYNSDKEWVRDAVRNGETSWWSSIATSEKSHYTENSTDNVKAFWIDDAVTVPLSKSNSAFVRCVR